MSLSLDIGLAMGWLLELLLLAGGLALLTRRIRHRWLVRLTLASFLVRLLIGQALYFISLSHLPVLAPLQLPNGFWSLGPDAGNYQLEATRVFLPTLSAGPVTFIRLTLDYFDFTPVNLHLFNDPFTWLLGMTYAIFGASPAHGLLLNAALAAVCVPLIYLCARGLEVSHRGALIAAAVTAFWPSTLAWSGQLLKDPIDWAALLAILAGASVLLSADPVLSTARMLWPALLAGGSMLFLASLRHYASTTLLLVGVASTVLAIAGSFVRRWITRAVSTQAPTSGSSGVSREQLVRAGVLILALAVGNAAGYSRFLLHLLDGRDLAAAYGPSANQIGALIRSQGMTADDAIAEIRAAAEAGESAAVGPRQPAPRPEFAPGPQGEESEEGFKPPCDPVASVAAVRYGYIVTGGSYLVDPEQQFGNCWDVAAYAPRALEVVYLSPNPLDPFRSGGATGQAASLGALDTLLLWFLLPGLVVGVASWLMSIRPGRILLLLYLLILGFALGFGVDNFGTLFRIRLQVLLPAAIVSAHGWAVVVRWLRVLRKRTDDRLIREFWPERFWAAGSVEAATDEA